MGAQRHIDTPTASGGPSLAAGGAVIESHLGTLPSGPGVYRMINAAGDVLYVGKAKNLKKRVASYTKVARMSTRMRRMVAETAAMEFVTTHTEAEALLLEANLIKRFAPRYNILLRDDKSFPSILLTGHHPFPQIVKHRGARSRKGEYFGPFASAGAVNQTLTVTTLLSIGLGGLLTIPVVLLSGPMLALAGGVLLMGRPYDLDARNLAGDAFDTREIDGRSVAELLPGATKAFDEFFDDDRVIEVDAPGLTSPVLTRFDFNNLPRPVFPLDQDAQWAGPQWD